MTEYSEKGLTLRWDAPDLVPSGLQGPGPRIVVAARPAHPSNVVTAIYTVDGGASRVARGYRMQLAPHPDGEEWFAVDLPPQENGALMAFAPVLSCSGREADPRRAGIPLTTLVLPAPAASAPAANVPQPTLRPFGYTMELLGRVTAPLEKPPEAIGETPDGLHIDFPLGKGGTVKGPRLNGEIEHGGGDWMLVRRDGVGLSEIRVLIRASDGAVAMGEYGGVVDFGADGYAALAAGRGPERAAVQLTPRYLTAAPQLRWLNRLQCVGLGRVTLATLTVEYDLYAMRSRAAETA
jgi:Protein of unknown function (DUF3237)